ncbi:MAG: NAD(P)H-dependent glycerol-3-phosphate dehydrogenase [Rhizobiaceae bacterium]
MSSALEEENKIAVLGGGAWGTALAHSQRLGGKSVVLWARDCGLVDRINATHENFKYLPGVSLAEGVKATCSPDEALSEASCVLVAIPAQTIRNVLDSIAKSFPANIPLVLCAKGIEADTGKLPSDIASELFPQNPIAALSGPSFAADVARNLPTAVTVASQDAAAAHDLAKLLSAPNLRCYSSEDLSGVEIGGALKNVLAIAAGIVSGSRLGDSAQAALITRGFVELRRVGAALGAQPDTLMGLSGLGDLILTCGSPKSRNFTYGLALGRNEPVNGLPLAEGVPTAGIAAKLAADRDIEAPIINAVSKVLDGTLCVAEAISQLMARPLKAENA